MDDKQKTDLRRPAEQWQHLVEPWVFAAASIYHGWKTHAHHWGHGPELTEAEFNKAVAEALAVKVG